MSDSQTGDYATLREHALAAYQILDSAAEEKFDGLVKLAAYICGAPVALISLLDKDRQWFKAKTGIDASETPISQSFCFHAAEQGKEEVYIVKDASKNSLFSSNPLVTSDPHIRFYAGAPLMTPDKVAIGTLCVIDRTPRELTPEQLEALTLLSKQVMYLLEIRKEYAAMASTVETLKIFEGEWPVCMYCRRIKDEVGTWVQLESYIRSRTHADFSHGVCPDCLTSRIKV